MWSYPLLYPLPHSAVCALPCIWTFCWAHPTPATRSIEQISTTEGQFTAEDWSVSWRSGYVRVSLSVSWHLIDFYNHQNQSWESWHRVTELQINTDLVVTNSTSTGQYSIKHASSQHTNILQNCLFTSAGRSFSIVFFLNKDVKIILEMWRKQVHQSQTSSFFCKTHSEYFHTKSWSEQNVRKSTTYS